MGRWIVLPGPTTGENTMPRPQFVILTFAAGMMSLYAHTSTAVAGAYGYDCAHGPDTYRVRDVEQWDVLNIRSRPSARGRIVGSIPATGSGVHCLGPCKGKWCRISWRGVIGWTNMRFLGE